MTMHNQQSSLACVVILAATLNSVAGEWPEWGGGPTRNMVAHETGLPVDFSAGDEIADSSEINLATAKNCRWVVTLGSESYGTPTIANGRVVVGTNNESPRNSKILGDRGVVMAFAEKSGKFLWQMTVPKLPGGDAVDWEYLGICSSTLLAGDHGYVLTNRGEVACLDLKGLADGNEGFPDEARYMAGPGGKPRETGPTDADIVWLYDMRAGTGAVPHNITSSSVAMLDGRIFASTSNGIDGEHENHPAPDAPCLIALNATSGALLGKEMAGIGRRTLHGNWSSPCIGKLDGRSVVFFGAGDGFLYAFDPKPGTGPDGVAVLPELWRYDANPKQYRVNKEGEPVRYGSFRGPSEIVGTPVFADGRVYVATGQDPESGDGVGMLSCVDAGTGKAIWSYQEISRSLSTPAVADGLVYIADYSGRIHCLDAGDGTVRWVHDSLSRIWGSTLLADDKLYVGTEDGDLIILQAGRTLKELGVVEFPGPIYSSPVAANRTLYIQTQTHLYAFAKK